MSIETIAFDYSYLAENAKTSYPSLGIPDFTETPDGDSEFRSICGFLFQGRGVAGGTDILNACIKGFGSARGATALIAPDVITNSDVQTDSQTGSGVIRFIISDGDGAEILDSNDITNRTDCDSSGDPANLPQSNWRREEILRGEYIHGFVHKDAYFLTYIIHYPTFYDFFNSTDGFYKDFTDVLADYTGQLTNTKLVPNALAPQADSVLSLLAIDLNLDTADPPAAYTSTVDSELSDELEVIYASPTSYYQNILFCRNDYAGASGLDNTYTPCYLGTLAGDTDCPAAITDTDSYPHTSTYLTQPFRGDVLLTEGYNLGIDTASPVFTFNAFSGAGAGDGPPCEDDTQLPDGVVRRINTIIPDEVGNVFIGGDKCLVVGPNSDSGAVEADSDDTSTLIHSYRMYDGHPNLVHEDEEVDGVINPSLMISGFCAQCCPCNQYEKVYKALEKVSEPVWVINNDGPQWDDSGLVYKANAVTESYNCIVQQYEEVYNCFADTPVTASVTGWGHYGYLVSAQVLLQNHGTEEITGNLTVSFDFGLSGDVSYVINTSYANLDANNTTSPDFNPVHPLEEAGNVVIEDSDDVITLRDGLLDLTTSTAIRRGRYMVIGVVGYLKTLADGDQCGEEGSITTKELTATVSGINAPGYPTSVSDTNNYECLSTLFLPTPCIPPLVTAMWVDGSILKVKLTDDSVNVSNISATLDYEYDWEEWVPTSTGGNDACGNTVAYGAEAAGSSAEVTLNFSDGLAEVNLSGLPHTPADLWDDLEDSIDAYCTCDNCGEDDPPSGCGTCTYPPFAASMALTLTYSGGANIPCEGSDDVEFEGFTFNTAITATTHPPTIFYHCNEDATGGCIH